MIEILQPNTPQQAKSINDLKDKLHLCRHLLTSTPELIIDKILRNEYVLFSINDQLRVIGFVFNNGVTRTFFIYWLDGKNIEANLTEMIDYVHHDLVCSAIELHSNTPAHHRLYRKLFKPYTTRESLLFRVVL